MATPLPIGTRRLHRNGYIRIKVANSRRGWRWEHHVVWESIHGPLPDGWCIHHVDGNMTHNAPENLIGCPSNGEHFRQHHADMLRENGRKVGAWNKGKPKSPEHRAKIAAANRGKPKSAEHRAKLAAANTGHTDSAETRMKKGEASRRNWTPERRAAWAERMREQWRAGVFDIHYDNPPSRDK